MASRALVVFLLVAGSALAQSDARIASRQVRVRIVFSEGRCDTTTRVTLMKQSTVVAVATANERCEADFVNVPVGRYELSVSSQTFSGARWSSIDVTSAGSAEFEAKLRRSSDFELNFGGAANALVSASDLGIPARARKEVDKANQLLAKQDLEHALEKLNKAVAIYPAYALAYNNMGVIYGRLGETARGREALQKAVSIDDHLATAYLNLGRINLTAEDFDAAEAALKQASALAPAESVSLLLLAFAEILNNHFDEAVANGQKAHALQGHSAVVHRVVARALEKKGNAAGAIAELEQFLEEEPTGPRADAARKEFDLVRDLPQGFDTAVSTE